MIVKRTVSDFVDNTGPKVDDKGLEGTSRVVAFDSSFQGVELDCIVGDAAGVIGMIRRERKCSVEVLTNARDNDHDCYLYPHQG